MDKVSWMQGADASTDPGSERVQRCRRFLVGLVISAATLGTTLVSH